MRGEVNGDVQGELQVPDDAGLSDAEVLERFAGAAVVDRDNVEFHRGWFDHELRVDRCSACGRWHHPPSPMCPACWSWDVVATPVSGRGTVHLLMLLHQGPVPGPEHAVAPHPVVVVELAEQEGLRVTSTVVDCPPEAIAIGMPVVLRFIDRDGIPFPAFAPATGGA